MNHLYLRLLAALCLTVLGTVACGTAPGDATLDGGTSVDHAAILNGTEVQNEFPETGALIILSGELCTATLIAPDVVLTAGHCVEAGDVSACDASGQANCATHALPTSPRSVSVGYAFVRQRDIASIDHALLYKAHHAVLHPKYRVDPCSAPKTTDEQNACATLTSQCGAVQTEAQFMTCVGQLPANVRQLVDPTQNHNAYDIGLVFLDKSVTNQTPATLAVSQDSAALAEGGAVVIAGYGQRSNPSATNTAPTDVGTEYWGTTKILQTYPLEIAVGSDTGGPESCHGDSGGPAYVDFNDGIKPSRRIVGVTSRSRVLANDCTQGSLYTRVDTVYDWIKATMEEAYRNGNRASDATVIDPRTAHDKPGAANDGGGCQDAGGSSLVLVALVLALHVARRSSRRPERV